MTTVSDPSGILGDKDETHVAADRGVSRRMFMEAPAALMLVDGSQKVLRVNLAAARLFGRKSRELTKMHLSDLSAGPGFVFKRKASSGPVNQMLLKKDQTSFPAQTRVQNLTGKNKGLAVVSVLDITAWQNRALSQKPRKEQGLARFFAILMEKGPDRLETALTVLREAFRAPGISLFENQKDPRQGLCFGLACRVSAPGADGASFTFEEKIPYTQGFLHLESVLSRGGFLSGPKNQVLAGGKIQWGKKTARQVLLVPVTGQDRWFGFLLVEIQQNCHSFEKNDISLLHTAAQMVGLFLQRREDEGRRRRMDAILSRSAKMEAIGTLSAGIAHDFNNLLFPIMSYCEMCMTRVHEDPEKTKQYLGEILKASERARDLVRQILFFSHQGEKKPSPLQVQPIVKECISLLRATIPAYIHFSIQIQREAPQVMADPARLHQMIMNLCINAFHAMNETGGTLGISVQGVCLEKAERAKGGLLPPGNYVRIQVSDTGQGIAPEIMERIFDPYFTTRPAGTGTGMGLSVVQEIVKAYKGYIQIESIPGKGSVFRIHLPQAPIALSRAAGRKKAPPKTGKGNILVVDNAAQVRESLEVSLGALGYRVFSHCLGTKALAAFEKAPDNFDLLITDMILPDVTGLELARKIKKTTPELPVILCTGLYDAKFEKQRLKAGISACLYKPVIRKDLAEAVHRALFPGRAGDDRGRAVNQ